jgi:ribosomal protein S18 acetylase RimI-like enzyme
MMLEVRPLTQIAAEALKRVASGYASDGKYVVQYSDSDTHTMFDLTLVRLARLYVKTYDHFDDETLQRYTQMLKEGYSFGAFDNNVLVGVLMSEPHRWNQSLWVAEFHVAETHRRMGIGRRLMDVVVEKAQKAGLRTIVCETQNTNAPAIQAYRKLGFRVEGVDIAYYSNNDCPDGEIAVFMKRRLT